MKMKVKSTSGTVLAVAAAAMFSVAPVTVAAGEKAGTCHGGNSCKGTSACATATSSCMGQNSCKGKGWIQATKSDCEAAGGTFEEGIKSM